VRIRVRALATLKDAFGAHEFTLELPGVSASTVGDILGELANRYPAFRRAVGDPLKALGDTLQVLVDGRNVIHEEGAATKVTDGSLVILFPPAAGG